MTIPFTLGALLADKTTGNRYIATHYDIPGNYWTLAPYGWAGSRTHPNDDALERDFDLVGNSIESQFVEMRPALTLAPDEHDELHGVLINTMNFVSADDTTDYDRRLQALEFVIETYCESDDVDSRPKPDEVVAAANKFYCFLTNVNAPDQLQEDVPS